MIHEIIWETWNLAFFRTLRVVLWENARWSQFIVRVGLDGRSSLVPGVPRSQTVDLTASAAGPFFPFLLFVLPSGSSSGPSPLLLPALLLLLLLVDPGLRHLLDGNLLGLLLPCHSTLSLDCVSWSDSSSLPDHSGALWDLLPPGGHASFWLDLHPPRPLARFVVDHFLGLGRLLSLLLLQRWGLSESDSDSIAIFFFFDEPWRWDFIGPVTMTSSLTFLLRC